MAICVAAIYTSNATIPPCQPNYLLHNLSIADNECASTCLDDTDHTSIVFSEISENWHASVHLVPTAGQNTFSGSCDNPDTASHLWTIEPAYTDVCLVPVAAYGSSGGLSADIGGVICSCNNASTWNASTTLHYTTRDWTSAANVPANTGSSLPVVSIDSGDLGAITALPASATETTTASTAHGGSASTRSATASSDDTSDDLQKKSNTIALGVGLELGIPTLLVGVIGLCMKCSR